MENNDMGVRRLIGMVPAVPLRNELAKYRTRARVAWLFSVHATCER